MRATGLALQKAGHGLAGNVSHEASYGAGADVHSCALRVDEDRFAAGDMKEVSNLASPSTSSSKNLAAVGIDLPFREGGKIDLLEDEIRTRCNH